LREEINFHAYRQHLKLREKIVRVKYFCHRK